MVTQLAQEYLPYMRSIRRQLHMHPEISFQEYQTSALIQRELTAMGIPFSPVGETAVIATIEGAHPGKTLALRADMDALSVQELSQDCPYRSTVDGVMHACGHDGHVAALLGAARILLQMRQHLHGTVKLFFEPGEEHGGSMELFESQGCLQGLDHCFGIHIWSDIPVGKIAVEAGARMAGTDLFTLKVTGQGAHASMPHQGVDAIVAAAAIVLNLQSIVSRELSPQDVGVVTIGKLTAGQRFNAIADQAVLEGNLRSFDPAVRAGYRAMIERIASHTAQAYRAQCEMADYQYGTPPLINQPEEAAFAQAAAKELFGEDCLVHLPPNMAGEDFAIFIEKVGGVFAFVGGGFLDRKNAPHHNGYFDIDEDSLPIAAALHAQYALRYLGSGV